MKNTTISSRRRFFGKAGVALSAPLAIATAGASQSSIEDSRALQAQLADIEDMNAIRRLQQSYAQHINAGAYDDAAKLFFEPALAQFDSSINSLRVDHFGERDVVELAADGKSAITEFHYTVQAETAIKEDCTLAEMALQQGSGLLENVESRVLENRYVKQAGEWKITTSVFHSVLN